MIRTLEFIFIFFRTFKPPKPPPTTTICVLLSDLSLENVIFGSVEVDILIFETVIFGAFFLLQFLFGRLSSRGEFKIVFIGNCARL